MLQVEPIQAFDGFGTGAPSNPYSPTKEYFYSQGFQRSAFGIAPKISIANSITNSHPVVNWFSQGQLSGTSYIYGFDGEGRLYRTPTNSIGWTEQHVSSFSSHGNGMIFDQKNRLLYANDEFLGMTSDGTTFTDNWKDLVLSTTDFRPMDTYEDWVVIGNKNQVALLSTIDDSLNTNALNLPSGFNIRCVKSGTTGILIGANFNNRGALILWDAFSVRSIAPWIWRNKNIQCIVPTEGGWIVITQDEILFTNGYSVSSISADFPDYIINDQSIVNTLLPQGADIRGSKLMLWGTTGRVNRQKCGLYTFDLNKKLWEFLPVPNNVMLNVTPGAVLSDSNNFTHLSYKTTTPDITAIAFLQAAPVSHAVYISDQLGQSDNEKVAEGVKLTLGVSSSQVNTPDMTCDISVKVCNARRNIFGLGITNALSTQTNLISVDGSVSEAGSQNKAQVGDEITVLNGINAGQVRHITSIANQGTNTETWTLDSALPNLTENSIRLNISPFKLAKKFSLSNVAELKELFFDIQDRIKGKKFFVKILIENCVFMPELKGGQFIYDDLGVKR